MMLKEIEDRIDGLEQATEILRDHIFEHGHRMDSKPLEFITQQINNFKREIKIRKDFPILRDL